ncbi:hypothetical protein ACQY0O_001855 [Thecaphora frezii]
MPSAGSSPPSDDGAESINFRAALAAFENNSSAPTGGQLHAPVARGPHASKARAPIIVSTRDAEENVAPNTRAWWGAEGKGDEGDQCRYYNQDDETASQDPVVRSNSLPRIRTQSNGPGNLSANPFASDEPTAVASVGGARDGGLLKAPWPGLSSDDDAAARLRKTGSGTSLRDLMQKSLPNAPIRSRSKSLAGRGANSLGASTVSTPTNYSSGGAQSPRLGVRSIIALYGGNGGAGLEAPVASPSTAAVGSLGAFSGPGGAEALYGGGLRTASPLSMASNASLRGRHMLDPSNEDETWNPLFGHAVMEPRPRSSSGFRSAPTSHPSSPGPTGSALAVPNAGAITSIAAPGEHVVQPPYKRTVSGASGLSVRTEPPRPPARNAVLAPSPSRSASSSPMNAGPRLPPRPSNSSAGSHVSEFGQISARPSSADTSGKSGASSGDAFHNVPYATYTPGAKRHGQGTTASAENLRAPPALPPRSATGGQAPHSSSADGVPATGEDGHLPYAFRTRPPVRLLPKSPSLPSRVTALPAVAKAERPEPPPRPRAALSAPSSAPSSATTIDGRAGGFRFGGTSSDPSTAPPPPARGRAPLTTHHRSSGLGAVGSDPTSATSSSSSSSSASTAGARRPAHSHSHAKTPSNVFTSISLSDDASRELRSSLESDILQRNPQEAATGSPASASISSHMPPPPRNRHGHSANRSIGSAIGLTTSSPSTGQFSAGKALWETASSALPLPFKSSAASATSGRALAEGAPSRQPHHSYVAGRANVAGDPLLGSRPGELDGVVRPGWAGQLQTRPVQLASPVAKLTPRSTTPPNSSARQRYECLFDACLKAQAASRAKRALPLEVDALDLGSVRGKRQVPGFRTRGAGSVSVDDCSASSNVGIEAAKGWFEPNAAATGVQTSAEAGGRAPASRSAPSSTLVVDADSSGARCSTLSMLRVRKVWRQSRLPDAVLAEIWDAAVAYQREAGRGDVGRPGLTREAFVRAMAAIDAELASRAAKRRARMLRRGGPAATGSNASLQRTKAQPTNGVVGLPERDRAGGFASG